MFVPPPRRAGRSPLPILALLVIVALGVALFFASRGSDALTAREDDLARDRAAAYFELFADLEGEPVRPRPRFTHGPSRLDRPWLPNPLVRTIRRFSR